MAFKAGQLLHSPLPFLSIPFLLEPIGCGLFLLLQAVDLDLIQCERLDGFDACYLFNIHKKTPCPVFTQVQGFLSSDAEVSGKTTLRSVSRKLTNVKSLELEMNLEAARGN
jgi:hypothetical protein